MSNNVDRSLCNLGIEKDSAGRHVVQFGTGGGCNSVVGSEFYRLMLIYNLVKGNYDPESENFTRLLIEENQFHFVPKTVNIGQGIVSITSSGQCFVFDEILHRKKLSVTVPQLDEFFEGKDLFLTVKYTHYAMHYFSVGTNVLTVQKLTSLRHDLASNFSRCSSTISKAKASPGKRIAKVIGTSLETIFDRKEPEITVSAEICVQLLLGSLAYDDRSKQEILAYSRSVLKSITEAENYENAVNFSLLKSATKILGEGSANALFAKLSEYGLHLSSYVDVDQEKIKVWRDTIITNLATSLFKTGDRCVICQENYPDKKDHTLKNHACQFDVPPELPTLKEVLGSIGRSDIDPKTLLSVSCCGEIPIIKASVFVPTTWKGNGVAVNPFYLNWLTRVSFYASLDLSKSRIYGALQRFYIANAGKYDPMRVFAQNTSILSGNDAFGAIAPKKLITPHPFQVDYLDRFLTRALALYESYRGVVPDTPEDETDYSMSNYDPTIVVDREILWEELAVPGNYTQLTDSVISYVSNLADRMGEPVGINVKSLIFKYACAHSTSYQQATLENAVNFNNLNAICAIAVLRARKFTRYQTGSVRPEFKNIQTVLSQGNLEEVLCAPPQMDSIEGELVLDPNALLLERSFTEPRPDSDGGTPFFDTLSEPSPSAVRPPIFRPPSAMSPMMVSDVVTPDIVFLTYLIDRLSKSEQVSVHQNVGKVDLDTLQTIAGYGKTTTAKMAGCLIRVFKNMYPAAVNTGLELVYVCDHPLVRSELFEAMKLLGPAKCKVSLATENECGKLTIVSNFKISVQRGKRMVEEDPCFQCHDRDIFIMGSTTLVYYVLGRKGSGVYEMHCGNKNAFVFIDEFGAKIGNLEATEALAETNGEEVKIATEFQKYAPSLLLLTNATTSLTLVGATLVPGAVIRNTLSCCRRQVTMRVEFGGSIYVASQAISARGENINLWHTCPADLTGDLFIGLQKPLFRRMVGHHAALQLRAKILDVLSTSPELHGRLSEMREYLHYDIGIFDGDSVANYAVGLLYLLYLYAFKYAGSAPNLRLLCKDMIGSIEPILKIPIPPLAPWPRSHFPRYSESYGVETYPAPPAFLEAFGIKNRWDRKVCPEAVKVVRLEELLKELPAIQGPDKKKIAAEIVRIYHANSDSYLFSDSVIKQVKQLEEGGEKVPKTPWTTIGYAVQCLRESLGIHDRNVTLILDTHPKDYALRIIAKILNKSVRETEEHARHIMTTAGKKYMSDSAANQARIDASLRQQSSGQTTTTTDHRSETTSARVVPITERQLSMIQEDFHVTSSINPKTNRAYIDPTANIYEEDVVAQYLLSWDLVIIENNLSEYKLRTIYKFVKEKPGRAAMVILGSQGAFGINVEKATCAILTPRAACTVSVPTQQQYFCRAGREGMSDDAVLPLDYLSMVRITEECIHDTCSALFPNIYLALNNFDKMKQWCENVDSECHAAVKNEHDKLFEEVKKLSKMYANLTINNWSILVTDPLILKKFQEIEERKNNVADEITRYRFISMLLPTLLNQGNSNRDCQILSFFIGAVQYHLHESCGITSHFLDSNEVLRPIWPRRSSLEKSETELLFIALRETSRMFSQARDVSSYGLFEKFMLSRMSNGEFVATKLIAEIARNVAMKVSNARLVAN